MKSAAKRDKNRVVHTSRAFSQRWCFCVHQKNTGRRRKATSVCVFREKIFSRTHKKKKKRFQRGATQSLASFFLNVLKTRSCHATERRAQRETHTDRETTEISRSKLQIGGAFLSLSLRKSARERVKNRSRRTHRTRKRRDFSRLRDTKTISPPPEWKSAAKGKDILKIGK